MQTTIRTLLLILFLLPFSGYSADMIDASHPLIINNFDDFPCDTNSFNQKCTAMNLDRQINNASCTMECVPDKDLHLDGKILSLTYDMTPDNSKVGYEMGFNGLDLSLFDRISIKIKGDLQNGFDSKIKIKIATWNDSISYTIDGITPDWTEFSIPLTNFKGDLEDFNWEGVDKITLMFESMYSEKKTGRIFADDITLLAKSNTSISLGDLKIQKYTKPRSRLYAFPRDIVKKVDFSMDHKVILKRIAADTWLYFKNVIDVNTALVMDNITVNTSMNFNNTQINTDLSYVKTKKFINPVSLKAQGKKGTSETLSNNTILKNIMDARIGDYTNITNAGLQILAILSAYDLGFIHEHDAKVLLTQLMTTLKQIKKWEGFYYNYYITKNGKISDKFISSVDNGWVAAGLICLRNSFKKEYWQDCSDLLAAMNFSKLYNPQLGQLHLGYMTDKKTLSQYHYALLNTEPRLTSLIAIGKGDIPEDHWFKLARTLPKEWDWQSQTPQGVMKTNLGVAYFNGYYTNSGLKFIPSWGGSMFESLMPLTVINERKYAPRSLGTNDQVIARLHIKYAADYSLKYWGYSPCAIPDPLGGYHEYGIPVLGSKGYQPNGVVTSHAIILALQAIDEKTVMDNLKNLISEYPALYGDYGLYDSVDIINHRVTKKYLALDQGMILITLCNYLNKGSIQKRFEQDPVFPKIRDLLAIEKLYE